MSTAGMEIHLDRLPLKRVESTEEGGAERFPSEIGTDEKRLDLIRRIDFSWVLDTDSNKAKKKKKSLKEEAAAPWPWQGLVENLQLAHQELSVIIDLINTVEANDAVTVAGMTRPKQLPNELLSDLSVSAATKLQRLRHLGKYFKQSSKSLENQVVREARFYGSLIRLQQNWKVKRQRQAAPVKSNEGFTIDLHEISLQDPMFLSRPSLMSMVPVDHDPTGMLTLRPPPKSSRSLTFQFLGAKVNHPRKKSVVSKTDDVPTEETVDQSVLQMHSVLREIHRAIFEEQVFGLVNREIADSPSGVNVTGMREDYLQLGIGQDTSVYLSLTRPDSFEPMIIDESPNASEFPNPICFEIYLRSILHEQVSSRSIKKRGFSREGIGLLGYFCSSIAHRVFSKKVLSKLEYLVERIPYLHLMTHPTWNSRRSSWSIYVKVPQSVSLSNHRRHHHHHHMGIKYQTSIHVSDESISVSGERVSKTTDMTVVNACGCDLAELPGILLQQIGTQVIGWLHEEAVNAGVKCDAEFLSLCVELGQGEKVRLAAHLDPDDEMGCISWWLVAASDDVTNDDVIIRQEDLKVFRKYLGHLSLESLYSILMDLTRLSNH